LSSDSLETGTGSSNSLRSATESGLCGFSAQSGEIARACGLICVTRGTGAAGVMSKRTMRKFDEMCLTPIPRLKPRQIRDLRLREGASQAVFARYLNLAPGLISLWERGEKPRKELL
jgi:DNA-binding transcriptional regulator YiaG